MVRPMCRVGAAAGPRAGGESCYAPILALARADVVAANASPSWKSTAMRDTG